MQTIGESGVEIIAHMELAYNFYLRFYPKQEIVVS
jgi:hypothetical protein